MRYFLENSGIIDRYEIEINNIYNCVDLEKFQSRYHDFIVSDKAASNIISLKNNKIFYSSNSYIPQKIDLKKKNLVIILGNPAPESVAAGAMFAYEHNKKRYHRFWNILHETGILIFPNLPNAIEPLRKMEMLYTYDYVSPFNIFILPFYSFPTPTIGKWSGVAGVKKLFGSAFPIIDSYEYNRITSLMDRCLKDQDVILTFQKDSFVSLMKGKKIFYNYKSLLTKPVTTLLTTPKEKIINLVCMLPTRLLHAKQTKATLNHLALYHRL